MEPPVRPWGDELGHVLDRQRSAAGNCWKNAMYPSPNKPTKKSTTGPECSHSPGKITSAEISWKWGSSFQKSTISSPRPGSCRPNSETCGSSSSRAKSRPSLWSRRPVAREKAYFWHGRWILLMLGTATLFSGTCTSLIFWMVTSST